jgi:hypothetical protein
MTNETRIELVDCEYAILFTTTLKTFECKYRSISLFIDDSIFRVVSFKMNWFIGSKMGK